MTENDFKAAVGKYPTGVTVISTQYDEQLYGFTANSFTSVSLNPSLISFCLNVKAGSFKAFVNSSYFAINILAADQGEIAEHFAKHISNKFQDVDYTLNDLAVPLLSGCLSNVECRKYNQIEAGDHYIFIGEVIKTKILVSDKKPLIYYAKNYRKLNDD